MTSPAATASTAPVRLHRIALSGHCHRAEAFLALLGVPYELVEAPADVRRSPAFLRLNPLGQIPVLEDGDTVIADSNAILIYLAERHDTAGRWYPRDPVGRANVQRWLSFAAGQLAYGPAAARLARLFNAPLDEERTFATAERLLKFMDDHLAGRAYLVGTAATIADLAMYAYTARAPEGGISLEPYAHIRAWLERVEALPGFVPMVRAS